ncbi:MAG: MATE family efflux transporter [Oscillospiraceae bacterium]
MSSKISDFTEGKIASKLIKFMFPILGALILQAMYGAVDLLVVGWFGTEQSISAVSTGSSVVNFVTFSIAGMSTAVTILMGQYIGQRRSDRVGRVVGGGICFFVALSVVLTALMLVLARPISQLMRAPEEALHGTVQYVRICGGGIFFIIAYNVISSVFRGLGNSKLPLLFVAIACVTNIAGDLLFVAVMGMDVAGAALATVLAQAVSVVLSLVIMRRQTLPFTLKKQDIRFNSEIGRIVRVGAPISLQSMLTEVSFMALLAFINKLGLDASSGYGVACKLTAFIMLIPSSLMQSLASFVAQNVGANKPERAKRAMLTGMAIGVAIGIVVAAVAFWHGDTISRIFTNNETYVARSAEYLKGFAAESFLTSIMFSFIGYFNGHGKTMFVMAQGLAQTFLVRLPMSYIMSIQPNASLTLIGLAAPSATLFGIVLNTAYFIISSRRSPERLEPKA